MGRRIAAIALRIAGFLLIACGAVWTLQGFGILMWPAQSFMLADSQWAINGAITIIAGLVFILLARRVRVR